MGTRGLLPCDLDRDKDIAFAYWYTGLTFSVELIINGYVDNEWKKSGPGYDSGSYDITNNFSLIINSVSLEDNDQFTCEIVYLDVQNAQKSLNVYVFSKCAFVGSMTLVSTTIVPVTHASVNPNKAYILTLTLTLTLTPWPILPWTKNPTMTHTI